MLLGGEEDIEVVAEASNGLEAVDKAARYQPTVVLMDIRMPELDGLEATWRILAADADALRILILTTFDLDEYVFEALSAGASGFVLKDEPPEQLIAAIRPSPPARRSSPAITKRVIQKFARMPRPAPPKEIDDPCEREREVFRFWWRAAFRTGDRTGALHQRDDRQDTRHAHPPEARPPRPCPGGRARVSDGALRGGRVTARRQTLEPERR